MKTISEEGAFAPSQSLKTQKGGKKIMEYLVEIFEGEIHPKKELICDFCGAILYPFEGAKSFLVKIYEEGDRAYIEEFLCRECKTNLFQELKIVNFEDTDLGIRETICSLVEHQHHGYVVGISSWDEALFLINNPFLVDLWGERF